MLHPSNQSPTERIDSEGGMLLYDDSEIIIAANSTLCRLLDYPEQALLGKPLNSIHIQKKRASDINSSHKNINQHDDFLDSGFSLFQKKDGTRIRAKTVLAKKRLFIDGENRSFIQCIILPDQPESLDKKTPPTNHLPLIKAESNNISFLDILRRELSSPVLEMLEAIRVIERSTKEQGHKALLSHTLHAGTYLIDTIKDVLELCMIEKNPKDADINQFNFAKLLETIYEDMYCIAEKKGIVFTSYIEPSIPNHCFGDAEKIKLLITKLIENAFLLTHEGTVRFEVHTTTDNRVRFEILDTGSGISEKQQSLIFQKDIFKDTKIDSEYASVAVGYALAQNLAYLMNGKMGFSSLKNIGTLAWCSLDIILNKENKNKNTFLHGQYIIYIDNDQGAQTSIIKQLKSWGADVDFLPNSTQSADHFQQSIDNQKKAPDLIIIFIHNDNDHNPALLREINDYLVRREDSHPIDLVFLMPNQLTPNAARHYARIKHTQIKSPYTTSKLGNKLARLLKISEPFDIASDSDSTLVAAPSYSNISHNSNNKDNPAVKKVYVGSILIVDNAKVTQMVTAKFLKDNGFIISCANSGWDAIYLLEQRPYDLILMDVNMPEIDGIETTRRIRKAERHQRYTPILAVTARMDKATWKECMFAGMDDYMTKPIDNQVLLTTSEYWVSRNQQQTPEIGNTVNQPSSMLDFKSKNKNTCINDTTITALKNQIEIPVLQQMIDVFIEDIKHYEDTLKKALNDHTLDDLSFNFNHLEIECVYMGAEWIIEALQLTNQALNDKDYEKCGLLIRQMPYVISETQSAFSKATTSNEDQNGNKKN